MKIESNHGRLVILDESGHVMGYGPGIQAIRRHLGMSTQEFAAACGISRRTVEGWEQGRMPNGAALVAMQYLLLAFPDAVRERARKAAANPVYADSVIAYHATGEQGNFALWNNCFDAARGIPVPARSGPVV
jgi:transcriptional regulator with XRE-family HTH domain